MWRWLSARQSRSAFKEREEEKAAKHKVPHHGSGFQMSCSVAQTRRTCQSARLRLGGTPSCGARAGAAELPVWMRFARMWGTAPYALQKLPWSSARFGLAAVPPQAGPTRSEPAPARKQENRRPRSRRRGRRVRGPRRHEYNRRTGNTLRKSLTPPVFMFPT